MSLLHRESHLEQDEVDDEALEAGLNAAEGFLARSRQRNHPDVPNLADLTRQKTHRLLS